MTGQRILIALLVVNLFATLLVYRGLQILVERVDRLQCEPAPLASSSQAQSSAQPAQADLDADTRQPARVESLSVPEQPATESPAEERSDSAWETQTDATAEPQDDIDAIKAQFNAQYGDSARTAQVHQTVEGVAGATARYAGITRDLVECKEKVCKLVLGYSDPEIFYAFVDDLTMALKGELSATVYFDTPNTLGGNSTVDIYLVRD